VLAFDFDFDVSLLSLPFWSFLLPPLLCLSLLPLSSLIRMLVKAFGAWIIQNNQLT
jgi:hypothetical protein